MTDCNEGQGRLKSFWAAAVWLALMIFGTGASCYWHVVASRPSFVLDGPRGEVGPEFPLFSRREYGWPLAYLSLPASKEESAWSGAARFSLWRLVSNVFVSCGTATLLFYRLRRRRPFRISMREVGGITLGLALLVSAWERSRRGAIEDSAMVAAIERMRGDLGWTHALREPVGIARQQRVISLDLNIGRLDLPLSQLSEVRQATISADLSSPTLQSLAQLSNLEGLCLLSCTMDRNRITMPPMELRGLNLHGSSVDDNSVAQVVGLRVLDLSVTSTGNDALPQIAKHRLLEWLALSETSVTSDGLAALTSLLKLRSLDLSDTEIDDRAIAILSQMSSLRELDVSFTSITDKCLTDLRRLDQLSRLCIGGTKISPEANRAIESAMPHCEVVFW